MTAMLIVALSLIAWPTVPPPSRPTEINYVRDLYNAYRWYRLPLPPQTATAVQWKIWHVRTGGGTNGSWTKYEPRVHFGWRIAEATATRSARLQYTGMDPQDGFYRHEPAEPFSLEAVEQDTAEDRYGDSYYIDLVAGLWHLQQRESALGVFKLWEKTWKTPDENGLHPDPLQRMRQRAMDYWSWKIYEPATSWETVNFYLTLIVAEDTSPDRFSFTPKARSYSSLTATLQPGRGRPGSVEEMIDRFINIGRPGFWHEPKYYIDNASELRVFDFESIPYLVAHLNDERLTRDFLRPASSIMPATVGTVCRDLLVDLSQRSLDWNRLGNGSPQERMDYVNATWFERAKTMGEEQWFLQTKLSSGHWHISDVQVALLRKKYPQRLPQLLADSMEFGYAVQTQMVLEHLLRSTLPDQVKDTALNDVLARPELDLQKAVLEIVQQQRPQRLKAELLRSLERIMLHEQTGRTYSYWIANDYLKYCHAVDDPQCWDAFAATLGVLEATFRTNVYETMFEICEHTGQRPETKTHPLRLLRAALNDSTLCVRPEYNRPDWPHQEYEPLTVQNYAALKLSWVYGQPVPYRPERSEREWLAIRNGLDSLMQARVRDASATHP